MNPLFRSDSYKFSQFRQYPPGMTYLSSYVEARSGQDILFFGLSPYLRALSARVTHEDIDIARGMMKKHGEPFNEEGFRRIVTDFGGRLPLSIQALPEGTIVPAGVILKAKGKARASGMSFLRARVKMTVFRICVAVSAFVGYAMPSTTWATMRRSTYGRILEGEKRTPFFGSKRSF